LEEVALGGCLKEAPFCEAALNGARVYVFAPALTAGARARVRAHCVAKCTTLKGLREHPIPGYDSELSFSEFL